MAPGNSLKGRAKRCNTCVACLKENCGTCQRCLDMPMFGGSGRLKKGCIQRVCLNMVSARSKRSFVDGGDTNDNRKKMLVKVKNLDAFHRHDIVDTEQVFMGHNLDQHHQEKHTAMIGRKDIEGKQPLYDWMAPGNSLQGKAKRCNTCVACLKENCGTCQGCLDMPMFGGSGRLKKGCIQRVCLNMVSARSKRSFVDGGDTDDNRKKMLVKVKNLDALHRHDIVDTERVFMGHNLDQHHQEKHTARIGRKDIEGKHTLYDWMAPGNSLKGRAKRCNTCVACLKENCGTCQRCLDMPMF